MAEKWRTEKKRPKIKVLQWPAIPTPTTDEVYAGVDEKKKAYSLWIESAVRQQFNADKPESLDGLRVLDCTANQIIGHWCSSHFAELGAEVIMVEPPGGDPLRTRVPFGREEDAFTAANGENCTPRFLAEARNKLSVTLNVETKEGQDLLKKIIPQVDVLIENAAPGHFDKLGIGYRQLSEINPRLVYLWAGGRGQRGPLRAGEVLGEGPVRGVHGGRRRHADHRLQLGLARHGRLRQAPLRELGPGDQHLRGEPLRRRADHGRRRGRPALGSALSQRRERQARARAAHLRGPEAARGDRPASALHAGRDPHHHGRLAQGNNPGPGGEGAPG